MIERRQDQQLPMFPDVQPPTRFLGATIDPGQDTARLGAQYLRVFHLMRDAEWRTLREISALTGDPEASVSARIRDFRRPENGGHTVERRRRGAAARGIFEYRLALAGAMEAA